MTYKSKKGKLYKLNFAGHIVIGKCLNKNTFIYKDPFLNKERINQFANIDILTEVKNTSN